MPRRDRTFSHRDVVRIYQKHLSLAEKRQVEEFFEAFRAKEELTENILELIVDIMGLVPGFGEIVEIIETGVSLGAVLNDLQKIRKGDLDV